MRTRTFAYGAGCILACGLIATCNWIVPRAGAQDSDHTEAEAGSAAASARSGMFLPSTLAPRTDSQVGFVRTLGGYDFARRSAQFEVLGDVSVVGPLAVRFGAEYSEALGHFRPSLGVRVQALSQERQAIDLAAGVFYRPEGFTEAEGEFELAIMLGHRVGRFSSFANVVYGQDPEAAERDGELRVAALYALSDALQAGLDARLRVDLGSEEGERRAEGGADYDLVAGPTASYALGPVAALGQAGVSVFGASRARVGAVLLFGLAGAL